MRIELIIDELALVGFDARDRAAIGDAVQAELTRLLSAPNSTSIAGLLQLSRDEGVARIPNIDAGRINLRAERAGISSGREIAGAVHRALPAPSQNGVRS